MPKLLIIADDLTGANDAAATFARQGIPVLVRPDQSGATLSWVDGVEVLAVTSESRHLDAAAAAARVSAMISAGIAAGVTNFFKKTDSTLRGNTGSELEALLTASGESILPFVPAVPQLKRTTRSGCQFVADIPLHQSNLARDPLDRIESSYIPEILATQSRISTWVINPDQRKEFGSLDLQPGIYVFDATTDDDLRDIVHSLKRCGLLRIAAGAAGLASVMSEVLDFERHPIEVPRVSGRILVVNGSLNDASIDQVAWAERNGFAVFTLTPAMLVAAEDANRQEIEDAVARILRSAEGRDVVIRTIEHRNDLHQYLEFGQRMGFKPREVHQRVADNVAKIISRTTRGSDFKTMAVFGGDTLAAIVRSFGWSRLWPRGEITPGFVVLEVDPHREILLLTKAGGFGAEDILGRIKIQ